MKIKLLLLIATMFLAWPASAQVQLRGRIVDSKTGEALAGAVIVNTRTNAVAVATNDGAFVMSAPRGAHELAISFLGYSDLTLPVAEGVLELGDILLESDAFAMDEVVVKAAGIITRDRQTPVAVSNITLEQLQTKLSNQEFPEILKSTPSVYATKQGGGYGDSRINMRGFNSENVGVLINGVPVNDMQNGRVYWSNWAGLSEVTSFMQVQRGLGASKLGLSSVGGTINILTKSTDAEAGGSFYYGIGNDGLKRLSMNVSTGLLDNGWAVTLAGGRSEAVGYVKATEYEAWNYFANVSKLFCGGRHRLSLTAFGAPQWHNGRSNKYLIQDYRDHRDGTRMNRAYGYINGKVTTGYGYNEYHKPQISLVHSWEINDKSSLSTSLYASLARGGGRGVYGANNRWISINGGSSGDGRPYAETKLTADGLLDYDAAMEYNRNSPNGSQAIFGKTVNNHDWYGILSSYTNQLTDKIRLTAGLDGRYYRGYHYVEIVDLLGGEYYIDNSIPSRPANTPLKEGDIISYNDRGEVGWAGVFAQGEYVEGAFSAFLSGSISANLYRYYNPGRAAVEVKPGKFIQKTDWQQFLPMSVKGGVNYKFADHHNVFANGGYFTRSPFFNSAFLNNTVNVNKDARMERVTTAELGYGFANNVFNLTVNGYYTLWLDKGLTRTYNGETYNLTGLNARHMGIELEATYRPSSNFNIKAMGSLGDWIWRDDIDFTAYDQAQNVVGNYKAFIAGVHVGNSAQATAALGVNWTPLQNLRLSADFNWFGKNFADYDPGNRTQIQDKVDAWQMPDYCTVDLSANYRFKIGNTNATLYGNLNNIFDAEYIADAADGVDHNALTSLVYYGFGRTWTCGLKINF